MYGEQ
jgi:hypothetical protein